MDSSDLTWAWRMATLAGFGVLAWFARAMWQSINERVDSVKKRFADHEVEDRIRFDHILSSLGELKGKVDTLIGELRRRHETS